MGNTFGGIRRLSVMLFAMVHAAVSIYSQRTVAEIYSHRTVAEINTLVLETGLRASSVTVSAESLCLYLKRRPAKADFD